MSEDLKKEIEDCLTKYAKELVKDKVIYLLEIYGQNKYCEGYRKGTLDHIKTEMK